jgi:hypothetical protein
VAYCLDDVAGDPTKPNSVELRAGPIAAGAPILPSQGRIRPLTADERIAWQVEFSPAGDFLLMSSPDPDPMVESLRVLAMSALGVAAPVKLIDDAGTWSLAHDQKTLYFLRRQDGARRGLHAVPFPAGGAPTKLADDVLDYDLLGLGPADRGVAVLTRSATPPARLFQILRPGAEPAAQTVFATDDALEDVQLSDDGRFTAWRNGHLVTRIVGHDDLSSCLLNTSANVRATPALFLASAGLVFWTEDAPEDPTRQDAYVAAPDGCRNKRRYARGLYLELPVGDRGLVFGDNYEDRNFTVSLKYAGARQGRDGWELGAPVPVTDGVDSAVVLVATDPPSLVFRKKVGAPDETGLYLLGPIAF